MSQLKVNELTNINNTGEPNIELHSDGSTSIRNLQNLAENVIINPEMKIHQRGGSVTGDGDFPVDRWKISKNDHGAYSGTQSADHPSGFGQSIQISCATAKASLSAGSNFVLFQRIEGFNVQPFAKALTDPKPFSVSFWFKTNKTGNYAVILRDIVNNRSVSHMINVTASATWVEYSHTFPADATGGWPSSNTNALEFQLWLCAGTDFTSGSLNTTWNSNTNANMAVGQANFFDSTSNECFLTGVQLTPTEAPIEFQHKGMQEYLSDCQRYTYALTNANQSAYLPINGFAKTSSQVVVVINYPVTMRVDDPGFTLKNDATNFKVFVRASTASVTNITGSDQTANGGCYNIFAAANSFDAGDSVVLGTGSAAGGDGFIISAEL
nr:putative carbohydrate binding domain containing protein [uncultured Mediterranean phage uvMED]